jgi:hypothetical protein
MTCVHRDDVGAYLLGALTEDEQERFVAHLPGCAECRRELEELEGVAGTIPLAAPQVAPPPELKERIMTAVRADVARRAEGEAAAPGAATPEAAAPAGGQETKRRPARERPWWRRPLLAVRPLPAAIGAAVLIAAGVAGGIVLSGGNDPARTVTARVDVPSAPDARASVALGDDGATLTVREFPDPPEGRVYQVWLQRPGRDPEPTRALFTPRDGQATVDVQEDVAGVERVLVTDEPRPRGSRVPTRTPVIVARLA